MSRKQPSSEYICIPIQAKASLPSSSPRGPLPSLGDQTSSTIRALFPRMLRRPRANTATTLRDFAGRARNTHGVGVPTCTTSTRSSPPPVEGKQQPPQREYKLFSALFCFFVFRFFSFWPLLSFCFLPLILVFGRRLLMPVVFVFARVLGDDCGSPADFF